MAWTDEQIAAIKEAVASGVTSVSHGGKTVTFASLAEMRTLLAQMERSRQPRRKRFSLIQWSRGD